MRVNGLLIVICIDNGICISVTFQEARRSSKFVRQSLIEVGFVPNPDKCIWEPTQSSKWLGLFPDTHSGELKIPTTRIESLLCSVSDIFQFYFYSTPRNLVSVTGEMFRHMYYTIESRLTWDEVIKVNDPDLLCELKSWVGNVLRLNCKKISAPRYQKSFHSRTLLIDDDADLRCQPETKYAI